MCYRSIIEEKHIVQNAHNESTSWVVLFLYNSLICPQIQTNLGRKKKNKIGTYIWYMVVVVMLGYMLTHLPSLQWLKDHLKLAIQIVVSTGTASFIGSLIEERNWSDFMKRFTKPIALWANLPLISATAIFSSFFSLVAANSMLTAAYQNQQMNRLQLRVSAMCTSLMSYIYHSLRIMYPTIAAVGIVGASYFGLLFGFSFFVVFVALLVSKLSTKTSNFIKQSNVSEESKKTPNSWSVSFRNAWRKTFLVLKKMFFIAIPMFLFFSFLSKIGFFDVSESFFNLSGLGQYIPPEGIAVATSMIGGILSAATVAAGFIKSGNLESTQVLLALLVGNIISLPIRSLRRSLPAAMSVFPSKEALVIVFLNQGSRFVSILLLIIGIMLLMNYQLI